jgi:hypothetical protein
MSLLQDSSIQILGKLYIRVFSKKQEFHQEFSVAAKALTTKKPALGGPFCQSGKGENYFCAV